jgi:hypothetical protein
MAAIQEMKEDAETLNGKFVQQQDEEQTNCKVFEVGVLLVYFNVFMAVNLIYYIYY